MVEVTLADRAQPSSWGYLVPAIAITVTIGVTWFAVQRSTSASQKRVVILVGILICFAFAWVTFLSPRLDPMTAVAIDDSFITIEYSKRPPLQIVLEDVVRMEEVNPRLPRLDITTNGGQELSIHGVPTQLQTIETTLAQKTKLRQTEAYKWSR